MDKIVVPTKFNKTGKRVLKTPLDERRIYAPADQKYRPILRAIRDEWDRKWDYAKRTYVESMAHWIASYVARDSTPAAEKYKVAKFLVEQSLAARGPMVVEGPGSAQRWSNQLGGIPELSRVEEESWEAYLEISRKAGEEMDTALDRAHDDCENMKRALWREIRDHIHYQYHPEDKP